MEYLIILVSAIFVNNILLAQFLGCCPFLGVSNKLSTAVGMSGAVCFVITLATLVTYLLQYYVLVPLHIEFMQTISFILVIAALVQFIELFLKKYVPKLYSALGIYLPLITTNCAVLGVALTNVQDGNDFITSVVTGFGTACGYAIAIIVLAGIREKTEHNDVPKAFKGTPAVLLTSCLMAIAFYGFSSLA